MNQNTKGIVTTGFVKCNNSILRDLCQDVSFSACVLYFVILSHRNLENNKCFPTREVLSKELNCHIKTIDKAINELKTEGYLKVIQGKTGRASEYYFPKEDFYENKEN